MDVGIFHMEVKMKMLTRSFGLLIWVLLLCSPGHCSLCIWNGGGGDWDGEEGRLKPGKGAIVGRSAADILTPFPASIHLPDLLGLALVIYHLMRAK